MISVISSYLTRWVQRWLPDAFVFVLLITIGMFIWGVFVVEPKEGQSAVMAVVGHWGNGFWGFLTFTMQMAMIIVTGYVLAATDQVKKLLGFLASIAKSPRQAAALVCAFATVGCLINWGFGLVVGALFAKEVARRVKGVDYGLLIASGYIGFLAWGLGLSGSMPLTATDANNPIVQKYLEGNPIPLTETIFTSYNIFAVVCLLVFMPILCALMTPKEPKTVDPKLLAEDPSYQRPIDKNAVPALKMEESRIIVFISVAIATAYLIYHFYTKGFLNGLNLNSVNLVFITVGLFLHKTPMAYMRAVKQAAGATAGVLIQFPFYAGIAGIMEGSGVGRLITDFFISISNQDNFPFFTFISSAIINFAVPSGGGHWIVQGPFVLDAARELGVDFGKATMGIAYGDVLSNMLQPFWALPALAVAGLGVRDIMGYTTTAMIFAFPIFTIALFFL